MSRQVGFASASRQEIRKAFRWYESRAPELGPAFLRQVDAAAARIGENPLAFPVERSKYRRVRLRQFPYALHFVIWDNGTVTVLACLHFRQSPERWPGA